MCIKEIDCLFGEEEEEEAIVESFLHL